MLSLGPSRYPEPPGVPLRGMLVIVALGVVLALAYNMAGLRSDPSYGIAWIKVEEELPKLEDLLGAEPISNTAPSQPVATNLPTIPELGHPLQLQLPKVKDFFDAEAALIIDARAVEEYAAGHIPGALNLPYEDATEERIAALDPAGRPIITYCGGGTCEVSMGLAEELIDAGHTRVLVFMGGMPQWEAAGYPVERDVAGGVPASAPAAAQDDAGSFTTDIDDPMAFFGADEAAPAAPQVPEMDRPIEAGIDMVKRLIDDGGALVIDAREAQEYEAGHIVGAVNIPYDSFTPDQLEDLDIEGRPVIVYCGGGTCEISKDLAWELIYAGQTRVLVYMGGFPEWEQAGHQVARGGPSASGGEGL